MPKATLIFRRKRRFGDRAISEMRLWLVPDPVRGSGHLFRYSLYYGRAGQRLVAYDNEPGKGDHRHYGDREEPYEFITPEKLIADFIADVRSARQAQR